MAFEGYIRYGGVELVNNARLTAYTTNLGIGGYRCADLCPSLPDALEVIGWKNPDHTYTTPGGPFHPPWYDSAEKASLGFAGIHILEWSNIDSSTYTATSQELVGDGASVSGERFAGREMTVRCLLFGTDLIACRHGFNWLTAVLREGDPCADNQRKRHTYADFLPYGKSWWAFYKDAPDPLVPTNVFQAVRYNGLSTTDDPVDGTGVIGSGNTYAKLSHAEGDPNLPDPKTDVLDLLIPLVDTDTSIPIDPGCGGNGLEFFIQCPTETDVKYLYRKVFDVALLDGPVIISEHEVGANCEGGAWYEVEFTLLGMNPFVWRWPNNMLAEASTFTFAQLKEQWLIYKDNDLTTDLDVYQAPILYGEPHTFGGLVATMFDVAAGIQPTLQRIVSSAKITPRARQADTSALIVLDPLCPPLVAYPGPPQDDFFCGPVYDGDFTTLRYNFLTDVLPKFTPSTVRFRLTSKSDEDMRDIQVRIIPPSGSEVATSIVEFHVTYLPARSQMFIDGVRKSIDIRTGDPADVTTFVWSPAEHLVLSQGRVGSYTFPEIVCGRRVVLAIDVPVLYNPSTDLDFDLITVQRDA